MLRREFDCRLDYTSWDVKEIDRQAGDGESVHKQASKMTGAQLSKSPHAQKVSFGLFMPLPAQGGAGQSSPHRSTPRQSRERGGNAGRSLTRSHEMRRRLVLAS